MKSVHNPDRYMSDLRQILSQGRKRIGLLVGAGAPISLRVRNGHLHDEGDPLIPGIDQITQLVLQGLDSQTARSAATSLRAELGGDANIESILSLARLRGSALGGASVHGLDGAGYKTLGESICKFIGNIADTHLPPERNAYNELVAWVSGTMRTRAVEIFTTNYDLLFEEAFERGRAPYFDGFSGGNDPFFDPVTVAGDDLPARWSRLWKLHGSLGWSLNAGTIVRGRGRGEAQLIYPDYLKYDLTQKQPYTALFDRLKQFLRTPDTLLLAIGFSFRDPHVSTILDEALAMNANASVFAFQFCPLAMEVAASRLASDRPNLSLYAADGAVISGVAGQWRPGELPKNWGEIRGSFWRTREGDSQPSFVLGDFRDFARFCALTQALDFQRTPDVEIEAAGAPVPAEASD